MALARSLFRKGASFTAAMVFEIASTNLVIELGIILALLISWQFTLAEFVGGPIMIVLLAVAFRLFVRQQLIDEARRQADRGLAGSMEGHAAMDMSITATGSFRRRLFSREGYTSVSHIFVMEWAAVLRDVVIGLLIAGAVGAWVPDSFWQHLFLTGHPLAARLWGPLIGPVISLLSFVCSIGNVPLAAVLWNGGISFGGVIAFIFADLIIIPILLIYRKYYGTRMMLVLTGLFYATMVLAGYIVEFVFSGLGLVPADRTAKVGETGVVWNYTTYLNIVFLIVAAALVVRFFRSGGMPMLRMMGGGPDEADHGHGAHAGHGGRRRAPRCYGLVTRYAPSCAAVTASFISDTREPAGSSPGARARGGSHAGDQAGPASAAGCGGQEPAAAGRRGGHAGRDAGRRADRGLSAGRGGRRGGPPGGRPPASGATAASWRIIKTTRGRDLPGITAVTATGTRSRLGVRLHPGPAGRVAAYRPHLGGRPVPGPGRGPGHGRRVERARTTCGPSPRGPAGPGQAVRWNGRRWRDRRRFGQAVGDAVVLGPADVWVFGQPGSPGRRPGRLALQRRDLAARPGQPAA